MTSLLVLRLVSYFDKHSVGVTTEPLEKQWYWPKIQRLLRLTQLENGQHILEEVLHELGA